MKRIFYVLIALFTLISCQQQSTMRTTKELVSGRTYSNTTNGTQTSFYFGYDNKCTMTMTKGTSSIRIPNFTYEAKNNSVSIYYDNTDYWKEEARGKLNLAGLYHESNNTITFNSGIFYCTDKL